MTDIPPDEVLPCGCIIRCSIVEGVNTLTVIPCEQSCVHYRNLIGMGEDKGISIQYRKAP
jgi:hypothetical protein